jgi:RNA polymerase sigma factor (sigma-70 family)
MDPRDTEIGGANGGFPSTSLAFGTRADDPSLRRFADLYWKPVYCLIRRAGARTNEEAKDLTQEFFVKEVLTGALLEKYAPERGRFRTFLKVVVTNFVRHSRRDAARQKRGGEVTLVSLEDEAFELSDAVPDAQSLTAEEAFDAGWRYAVVARAVDRVRSVLAAEGKDAYFEVFRRYDVERPAVEPSYRDVGEALGLSADTVKNYLTRARQEFRDAVIAVLRETVATPEELAAELRDLFGT